MEKITTKKVENRFEIYYAGDYIATVAHNINNNFKYILENAHKSDLDKIEEILNERLRLKKDTPNDCSGVHDVMRLLFEYKFCPMCGTEIIINLED